MKLLVAHPSPDLYGSDRQLLESIRAMRGEGWDVTVVLPADGPLVARLRELPGVAVRFTAVPVLRKSELRPARLAALAAGTPGTLRALTRLIADEAPDLVYVNTVTLPHWIAAARRAARPALVHVHEAEEMTAPALRRVLYAPLLGARAVVVNSATTERVVGAANPRVRARLVRIPNGVPDPGPAPTTGAEPGRLVVVSRLSPRKGVDVALDAVGLLRSAGRDVSLDVWGSTFPGYEWFAAALAERAQRPDLAGHVRLAGFTERVPDALAAAQVVIVPSLGESFGLVAVEGMLAGRPVVASDVQGLAEIVTDGESGTLVPPGDAAALAAAVAALLDDPVRAGRLAGRGRAVALERFGVPRYRAALVDTIRTVAGPDDRPGSGQGDRRGGPRSRGRRGPSRPGALAALSLALAAVSLAAGCTGSSGSTNASSATSVGGAASGASTSARPSSAPTATVGPSGAPVSGSVIPRTTRPVPRTPIPAPASGNITQTVPSGSISTRPAVGLAATASFGKGVSVRLVSHAVVSGKAVGPGEISGPATRLVLRLTNGGSSAISLANAVVSVSDARHVPLVLLTSATTDRFRGSLAAGRSATGTYVFTLDQGRHNPYTITVSYSPRAAVVQFVGDAA